MSTMSERHQALYDLLKERDKLKKENKQLKEYTALLEQRLADAGQEVMILRVLGVELQKCQQPCCQNVPENCTKQSTSH